MMRRAKSWNFTSPSEMIGADLLDEHEMAQLKKYCDIGNGAAEVRASDPHPLVCEAHAHPLRSASLHVCR